MQPEMIAGYTPAELAENLLHSELGKRDQGKDEAKDGPNTVRSQESTLIVLGLSDLDDPALVNRVTGIKAYAKVLLHQEMYTQLPEAMIEARTNFLPCKESSDLLIKYISYANTKLRAYGDSFKRPYDPLAAFKTSKNFGGLLLNANVEQEQHVDEFECNVAPRIGVDLNAFMEARARLERTAQLQADHKVAEALKSIPCHAQEAITNLTSALPLLQCCRDFIDVTATEINSQPKVNAHYPYVATSREALSAIKAVVNLLRSWLKDLTMQHLLQGGSYSLVSFGKRNETLENMGLARPDGRRTTRLPEGVRRLPAREPPHQDDRQGKGENARRARRRKRQRVPRTRRLPRQWLRRRRPRPRPRQLPNLLAMRQWRPHRRQVLRTSARQGLLAR